MPPHKLIFPLGGLDRRLGYQSQRPFTTPDCINVRGEEAIEGRERGGSRPGIIRSFGEQLGSGNPVRLLDEVRETNPTAGREFIDTFSATDISPFWTSADWVPILGGRGLPVFTILNGNLTIAIAAGPTLLQDGLVLDKVADLDSSNEYSVFVQINSLPIAGFNVVQRHSFWLRLDDTNPDGNVRGVLVLVERRNHFSGIVAVLRVSSVGGGQPVSSGFVAVPPVLALQPLIVRISINADLVSVWFNGIQLVTDLDISSSVPGSGTRTAIGAVVVGAQNFREAIKFDWYAITYPSTIADQEFNRIRVLGSSNGLIYRENNRNQEILHTVDPTLATDRQICSAEHTGQLFIADWGTPWTGSDGTLDAAGVLFDSASGPSDWRDTVNKDDHVVDLLNVGDAGLVTIGTYAISSVAAAEITLAASASTDVDTVIAYRIERVAKVYDTLPGTDTLAPYVATSGLGTVPAGCKLIARAFDRIFMAAPERSPHQWFCSRAADPFDWLYGASFGDLARPLVGQNSDAGLIGPPMTAMAAWRNDYLIMSSLKELWVLRGDPAGGGRLSNLSKQVGVVGAKAWTYGPSGEFYFMSRKGLYMVQPGAGSTPQPLSEQRLPRDLRSFKRSQIVQLAYDSIDNGIWIFTTDADGQATLHWWFNLESGAFWPVKLRTDHEPFSVLERHEDDGRVILGCRDGYIRHFQHTATTDDGFNLENYITLGPFRASGNPRDWGLIKTITGVLGKASSSVGWSLHPAVDAQSTITAVARGQGNWVSGRNRQQIVNLRAGDYILKISGLGSNEIILQEDGTPVLQENTEPLEIDQIRDGAWAFEAAIIETQRGGLQVAF